jgi:ribosomal-protein-alanine N-acetyltransferase
MGIKKITVEQLKTIVACEEEFNGEKYTYEQLENMIKDSNYVCLSYFDNDVLCGYLIAQDLLDYYDLLKIYVLPQYRKKGIGRELIDNLNKKILLEVREKSPAITFYEKMGFSMINIRKNYYSDGTNAIIMQRLHSK